MDQNKYISEINRLKEAYRERDQDQDFWGYKSWGLLDPIIEFSEFQYKRCLLQALRDQNISYDKIQNLQVLDIGCGWGRNLQFFSEIGVPCANLTGIDIIEHNLELGRKINPTIHYINGNVIEHNFKEKKFDIIIIHTVFSSLLEPELHQKLLDVAINLLSAQGILVIYDILAKYKTSKTIGLNGKPLEYIRGVDPTSLTTRFLNQKHLKIKIDYLGLSPRWRNLIFVGPFRKILHKINFCKRKNPSVITSKIAPNRIPNYISNCRLYIANLCSLFKPTNGYFAITVRKVEK